MTLSFICLIALILIIIVCVVYYKRNNELYIEAEKLPGPPGYPLIGSAHLFIGSNQDILRTFQELLDTYPSPFRVWLGNRVYYASYDPEQLKTILLSSKATEKEEVYKFLEPWAGTGLLTAPASKWRIHRKLIMPTFNQRILDSFVEVFYANSELLAMEMEVELNGKGFEVYNCILLCTLDILFETAMGIPLLAQKQKKLPYIDAAHRIIEIINMRMFKVWLHPDFIFNLTELGKEQRNILKILHNFTNKAIERKKQEPQFKDNQIDHNDNNRKTFLDLLMELSDEGKKFTDKELQEEVDTMTFAGMDTSSSAMSFIILMLANHPEVQLKVYEELCHIYGRENASSIPIQQKDLHRMEYLERVIKETLRLFPPLPLISRRLTDDLDVGGYKLKKGCSVVIAIIKMHRSEDFWVDPLKFDPDRFLPEEAAKRHQYTYMPFSAGPRNCIGMKFAMMEMKTILATLVRKYVFKNDSVQPIKDIKITCHGILKPVEPIIIKIERRFQSKEG